LKNCCEFFCSANESQQSIWVSVTYLKIMHESIQCKISSVILLININIPRRYYNYSTNTKTKTLQGRENELKWNKMKQHGINYQKL